MKTPNLRTFLILSVFAFISVIALRLWAENPSEPTIKGDAKCDYPFVLTFNEVGGHPVNANKDKAQDFRDQLKNIKGLYDLDFYEGQEGSLKHYRILPEGIMSPPQNPTGKSRQISPHITQTVSVRDKAGVAAVMNLVTD